jgi:dTDP-4-amino-4,6-dideoxygalactose transaminase
MKYKIPVFQPDLPPSHKMSDAYAKICESKIVSNFGQFTQQFENIAKEYLGNDNVIAVNSCDSGLIMTIAALDLPKGSTVLLPSFTFTSTVNAVVWNGLNPVFVDIDSDTFNIDVKDLERKVLQYKPTLIMATHIFGNPCELQQINQIAFDNHTPIIYDAAHAYGSKYAYLYKVGDIYGQEVAHVYSFSGTKLVTCGEGGLISTTPEMAEKIKYLRGYGFIGDYNARYTGLNGKISELNAAMGCLTLPTIEDAIKRRYEIVEQYKNILGDKLKYQKIAYGDRTTYKDFAVLFENKEQRDKVRQHLEENGIQTKIYFYPLHMTDRYKNGQVLPNTEKVYDIILCLPIFSAIKQSEIEEVCVRILECIG